MHPQSFVDSYKATRIIETLENYAIADQVDPAEPRNYTPTLLTAYDEYHFWNIILTNPEATFDTLVRLENFTLTEWVPRVPGLYWNGNARQIRHLTRDIRSVYRPFEKSRFVMGGMGTNLLPSENGQRVVGVCQDGGACGAIPMLIPDAIWNRLSLHPGHRLTLLDVRWKRMTGDWSQRFESMAGIPRAYLCVEDESQVTVSAEDVLPVYQPYTILEYVRDNVLLYDYVFCSAQSINERQQVSDFFEKYRKDYGNNGRYLLNPDPASPLFDSAYNSPEQLGRTETGGQYHLELLKERIRDTYFKDKCIDDILEVMSKAYDDSDAVRQFARHLGFPTVMFASNKAADRIAQLVDWCINTPGKIEELVDKLVVEQPDLLHI